MSVLLVVRRLSGSFPDVGAGENGPTRLRFQSPAWASLLRKVVIFHGNSMAAQKIVAPVDVSLLPYLLTLSFRHEWPILRSCRASSREGSFPSCNWRAWRWS